MMNRLKWYINRFSLMSLAEIGYRLKEACKRSVGRKIRSTVRVNTPPITGKKPAWYFDLADNNSIAAHVKGMGLWMAAS